MPRDVTRENEYGDESAEAFLARIEKELGVDLAPSREPLPARAPEPVTEPSKEDDDVMEPADEYLDLDAFSEKLVKKVLSTPLKQAPMTESERFRADYAAADGKTFDVFGHDRRDLYLRSTLWWNYTKMVPDDYTVTFDNIVDAEQRLHDLISEHRAQERLLEDFEKLSWKEQLKYTTEKYGGAPLRQDLFLPDERLSALMRQRAEAEGDPARQAAISAEINNLPPSSLEALQAANGTAMKKRKSDAKECIKRLQSEIRLVKSRGQHEKRKVITEEKAVRTENNTQKNEQIMDEKAEKRRLLAEKEARVAAERAERLRLAREKEARVAAERAERLRLAQERQAQRDAYNRLLAEQIEQKRLEKERKELEQAKRLQKELKQQAAKIKNYKKNNM